VYDKKLKRGKDGSFTRYIGQNARGVPEKLRLGYDQEAAEEKVRLIAALWTEIEGRAPLKSGPLGIERAWMLPRRLPRASPRPSPAGTPRIRSSMTGGSPISASPPGLRSSPQTPSSTG
jgi:hypothetical protein